MQRISGTILSPFKPAAGILCQFCSSSRSFSSGSDSSSDDEQQIQQTEQQPETSSSSSSGGSSGGSSSGSGGGGNSSGAAGSERAARGRGGHLGLDDPELNIYLRYNTDFVTDLDRAYSIGQLQAFEKNARKELRKGLAAQRLQLRDQAAAAAAGSSTVSSLPLREQMQQRLMEMQEHMASLSSGGSK